MKRTSITVLIASVACCSMASPSRGDEAADWLRITPGDAHFFVEIRGLNEIRGRFASLGIWETVQGLGTIRPEGVPAPTAKLQAGAGTFWHPDVAIAILLGRRSAMLASTSAGWQAGLVICEAINETHIEMLLQLWAARRTGDEGLVKRYVLEGGSLLAIRGSTMVFGPAGDPDRLWEQTVLLLAGRRGRTLGARAEFASLKTRLSRDYPALIYSSWPKGDPGAFAGCERLIAGASVEPDRIVCELHGHLGEPGALRPIDSTWLKSVPMNTIAAWSGSHQPARSPPMPHVAPQSGSIADFLTWMVRALDMSSSRIIDKIGPGFTMLVGTQPDSRRPSLLLPQLTVAIEIDPEIQLGQLDALFGVFVKLLVAMTNTYDQPAMAVEVAESVVAGMPCRSVPVGPALAKRGGLDFLHDAEFCWAVVDGRLLLSSSSRHMKEVIESRRDRAKRSFAIAAEEPDQVAESLWIRGDKLAELCSSWLDELQRSNPAAMQPDWWKQWASGKLAGQKRLGLGLVDDSNTPSAALVREIGEDSPARGIIELGDLIVGASGEPLGAPSPARQVAQRYAARGPAREFLIDLRRGGEQRRVAIPVEPDRLADLGAFDPIRALRQVIAISRPAAHISVTRKLSQTDWLDARLEVKWNAPAREDD